MGNMNIISAVRYAITGQREGQVSKFMSNQAMRELYNELNRELFKYIYRGSPHVMDDNMSSYVSNGYTYNSLVYSIINYMATTAAAVDWKLEMVKGEEKEEITDHEFLDFWNQPNPDQTIGEFIEAQLIYKYITGNTYIYAPRLEIGPNKGKLVKMEVMPSHQVQPIMGTYMKPVRGFVLMGNDYEREMDISKVLHIKYINPDVENTSPVIGMSPLKALVKVITQNNDAWTNLASAFQNGGPAGFFSRDGATPDAEFTPEQGEQLLERLRRSTSGPANTNKMAAVGGNVKWNQVGLSPVDLNVLEAIKVSFVQICNAYKFPAVLLNFDSSMTYNNYLEAQKILWSVALKQDLKIIAQKVTAKYLPAYGEGLRLVPDYSNIEALQADKEKMVTWLSQAWWIKADKKQEIMGEDVDENMAKYFIPAGLIPVDEIPEMETVEENRRRLEMEEYG